MALNAYLTAKFTTQGDLKGSVTQKGREGSSMVVACSHEIISPRDEASGLPSGKRQHKPIVITKPVDTASVQLLSALSHNENIKELHIKFWAPQTGTDRASATGSEVQFYSIDLVNASVCSYQLNMFNNLNPDEMKLPELEEVAFVYQKITWTWTKGGITAMDDWETPVA